MPADTSQTERIRRLRSTIQAVWHAECGICPEGTESLYLSRRFGQMVYYRPDATGAAIAESCCSSAVVPPTPCKPSTVVATQINYTNQFVDSVVVTFEGGPPPILLTPGQSTGLVTGITSYTINCLTPCVPSTVTFPAPTTVPYIVNTFSTPIVVRITNNTPRPITVTLNPGQYTGPYTNITNYTITCSSAIDITCNSQPPLPSLPNAITFTNRDVSDIVVTSPLSPSFSKPIILSPGQSSDQFVDITQYTAQCVTPVTLDLTCAAQPVPPPLFNAVTFHNAETVTTIQISVDLSGTSVIHVPTYIVPGEYSEQYLNLISYTIICVKSIPLQCNSSGTIPSGIIQFTNTTSTDMLVSIGNSSIAVNFIIPAGGSSRPLSQESGESYTVKCITDISLICTSSGTLTAPNAVRFINTTTDAMVITYESGTALTLTLTLNPGSTSSIIQEITSYSVTCIPVTNIRISCNSAQLVPPSPNALTFTNTETLLPVTLNTGSIFGTQVGPGVTTTIITNVSSYSVSCPALLQISSCTGAQPPVPSGEFIVQNTSTSVISIVYQMPKGDTISFILNPGKISPAQNGWSSYTVSCPTLRTVTVACGDSLIPSRKDIINFYNTSPNMMAIELSYGSIVDSIVVPANSYSPYMFTPNLYTATCPTPTTIVMACGASGVTTGITRFQNTSAYTRNVNKINVINGGIPVAANSYSDYFANFGNYKISC